MSAARAGSAVHEQRQAIATGDEDEPTTPDKLLRVRSHRERDGQKYTSDAIILPGGVRGNWWRKEGHALTPGDLTAVLEASAEVLVVGQGAHGLMKVTDEALACRTRAGIEAVCLPTGRAVEEYNRRCEQGQVVAAAWHLTC